MLKLGGYTITSTVAGTDYLNLIKTAEGLGANDPFQIKSITFYPLADTTVKIHNTFVPLISETPFGSDVAIPRQIVFSTTGTNVRIAYAY